MPFRIKFRKFLFKVTGLILFTGILLMLGCRDIRELDKYQHPSWLEGKLYTMVSNEDDLSTFATCLQRTGYDSILNLSGSFTVFAPTNTAFEEFFKTHANYNNSIENIPLQELERIVKIHIIQNAWSKSQLQMLDVDGWIDPDNPYNNKARGYKRQTVLKDPNKKYWINFDEGNITIVDSINANRYKKVFTNSRKYAPFFYDEYFNIYNLKPDDYEFYFGRPFESGNIYYAGGKLAEDEIFAENGFVYKIDRVIEPLMNGEQILQSSDQGYSYSDFLKMIYLFPDFKSNLEETYKQPEAKAGADFDTLYNLTYPGLVFNIQEELTGPNTNNSNYTVRYHNGLLAPTNEAFQTFLDEIVTSASGYPHWPSYDVIPKEIKKLIVNTYMCLIPVYESDLASGFENGEGERITVDASDIVQKYYGSNCTFLGLNKAIVPRAFSSVTGPIYLRPGYSFFRYAMQTAKVLPALKKEPADYAFYSLSDNTLMEDSSFVLVWDNRALHKYHFEGFNRSIEKWSKFNRKQIRKMILNQVGVETPSGIANKEFIENLAGNYIIVNNINQTISGGIPSKYGYGGDSTITVTFQEFEEPSDNGKSYSVNGWFLFPTVKLYGVMSSYTKFMDLLIKAGLFNTHTYEFNFLSEGEFYTIFMPSEQALNDYQADTLSIEDLRQFLKYHFIKGSLIFTDGKKPAGAYETLSVSESSTEFNTYYSTINLVPGPDYIKILNANGLPYVTINENESTTNIMVASDTDPESSSPYDYIITSVIHEIDTVLIKQPD